MIQEANTTNEPITERFSGEAQEEKLWQVGQWALWERSFEGTTFSQTYLRGAKCDLVVGPINRLFFHVYSSCCAVRLGVNEAVSLAHWVCSKCETVTVYNFGVNVRKARNGGRESLIELLSYFYNVLEVELEVEEFMTALTRASERQNSGW